MARISDLQTGDLSDGDLVPVLDGGVTKAVAAENVAAYLQGKLVFVDLLPSGDTTGGADVAAINAAVSAVAGDGGTVRLGPGDWYINNVVTIPQRVNLWGAGIGEGHAATRIVCTNAGARIAFGTRTTGGRGGMCGNFLVDGAGVATNPLFIGLTVQRTFVAMESTDAASIGLLLEGTQNCTFLGCCVSHADVADLVIDYSAAGNRFYNIELDSAGQWAMIVRQSGAAPPGLHSVPFDNHVYGGIFERAMTVGCVWQQIGDLTGLHDVQLVHVNNDATFTFVRLDEGTLAVSDGYITTTTGLAHGTAFDVDTAGTLTINGTVHVNLVNTVLDNAGATFINGNLRAINPGIVNQRLGNPPIERASYGAVGLGSMPIVAAAPYANLATTLAAGTYAGSWWTLDPAGYDVPAGRRLEFRLVATFHSLTDGDVAGAVLINGVGGAGMTGEATATKDPAVPTTTVRSSWTPFPATITGGYLQVRNATAARGTLVSAHIETRIA